MASATYEKLTAHVSAKSLIVDLISTISGQYSVGVGALVSAGALFGLGENSMRVALARLRASGTLESAGRGLYRLSPAAHRVNREVVSWSRVEEKLIDWDGSYLAVDSSALPARDRRAQRVRHRAFRLLGFESLTPALAIRPNNLAGGAAACRDRLTALGVESASTDVPIPVVFEMRALDVSRDARARSLWDVAALERGYRETNDRLAAAIERMPRLSRDQAMIESFSIGGAAVKQIVHDPLLPHAIVDTRSRHQMIEAMRRYDVLGKQAWRPWAGESVELHSSPVDGRGLEVAAGSL